MIYYNQPDGISCGPTCIKMVGDFFKEDIPSIKEICSMCETDSVIGTPPERMRKGMDKLNLKYVEHINEINPYQSLRDSIDRGSVNLVRTITHGVPHWILIYSYEKDTFHINDPWLGQFSYNETELKNIWEIREYYYFEVTLDNQTKK
jgi:ABC-type bacteriocin/lantibiotic exporter with double-glycine peptidase domain